MPAKQKKPQASPGSLKKLKTGVNDLFARLEQANAAFLAASQQSQVQQQLRKAEVGGRGPGRRKLRARTLPVR